MDDGQVESQEAESGNSFICLTCIFLSLPSSVSTIQCRPNILVTLATFQNFDNFIFKMLFFKSFFASILSAQTSTFWPTRNSPFRVDKCTAKEGVSTSLCSVTFVMMLLSDLSKAMTESSTLSQSVGTPTKQRLLNNCEGVVKKSPYFMLQVLSAKTVCCRTLGHWDSSVRRRLSRLTKRAFVLSVFILFLTKTELTM